MATFAFKKDSLRYDGTHYTLWKNQMECHLRCISEDYWKITKNVYTVLDNGPSTLDEINEAKLNIRATEALLSALFDSEMTNVMDMQTVHEI